METRWEQFLGWRVSWPDTELLDTTFILDGGTAESTDKPYEFLGKVEVQRWEGGVKTRFKKDEKVEFEDFPAFLMFLPMMDQPLL